MKITTHQFSVHFHHTEENLIEKIEAKASVYRLRNVKNCELNKFSPLRRPKKTTEKILNMIACALKKMVYYIFENWI